MTPKDRKFLKAHIQELITKCENELEDAKKRSQPVAPDNSIGRLSRMEAIGQKSIQDAFISRLEKRIPILKETLEKVDNEDFGLCVECDEEISMGRLKAMPEGKICPACLEG